MLIERKVSGISAGRISDSWLKLKRKAPPTLLPSVSKRLLLCIALHMLLAFLRSYILNLGAVWFRNIILLWGWLDLSNYTDRRLHSLLITRYPAVVPIMNSICISNPNGLEVCRDRTHSKDRYI